jgi:uncharacterized protein (TIGR02145 family)
MIKPKNIGSFSVVFALLLLFILSCKKEPAREFPLLVTVPPTNLAPFSLTSGGNITLEGSSSIVARGVCWSIKPNPTIKFKDSITVDGAGLGAFVSAITGLNAGTTYYLRAYATNGEGTGYGNELAVPTLASAPTLTTLVVTALTDTTVSCGGNISTDGGAAIINRGVCWSTSKNPTTSDNVTTDGKGIGSFSSLVTGLNRTATYYLRAYATNIMGTAYGEERTFSAGKFLVKDGEGNFYHFTTIGSQVWMVENLRTSRFQDNSPITLAEDPGAWSSQANPAYCWYNNDSENKTYGALYNWYAVNSGKLCPTGWHVPTDADWTTLSDNLGGELLAGAKLKETGTLHWKAPNALATNTSGFTALPGGFRTNAGEFANAGSYGNWWSNTAVNTTVSNYRYLYYGNGAITKSFVNQKYGLSVRCVKN